MSSVTERQSLVSVAIITYNQKEYLRECIESVLAQDYPNIEIVVADDCSTDSTQDMLREYEKQYPGRFILKLAEKNQGITKNSNEAQFACTGKYIAWMGGDDLMLPGKISKQVDFMEAREDCDICYHNLEVFDSDTGKKIRLFNTPKNKFEGDVRVSIRQSTFNGACSNMVRASKVPEHGFRETLPVASDWMYWIEILHYGGGKIYYIDEVLGRYRKHANNVTRPETYITQNELDHLNTCNLIMSLDAAYFPDALYIYAKRLQGLRHKLNYPSALLRSFVLKPGLKPLAGLFIYGLTLGKVRL
ncbi:glycosyltransferase involved in cell wall biosynthesis [Desulfobotulus alkaliphilus]|uniref:Glycosyltransferase involved in cell wall biosynthesis n=1 Tax=Desulfobotulus alkaliphilus TaxID=622671 RepID=A0A562S6R5_9BACT|nr:glycosyltransferase [Desulfobotulus alkaliphilus]TWI76908.1 glycosyltransferase involved in cell wall biosynthesis [Desulfobotulus alkaliphilus]